MQVPVRITLLLRRSVAPGVLLGVGFSTLTLAATPFLLDLIGDEYDQGLTVTSLIGVAQLGGFVLASWVAGQWLRPRRRVFVAAVALALVANLGSVALPPFVLLVALRFLSGMALGVMTWFAWVQVFGDDEGMADVGVIGPVAGVFAAPLVGLAAVRGGAAAVFALLAVGAMVVLAFNRGTGATDRVPARTARSRPVPAAAIMLAALGLFTLGGSAVFAYAVVIGTSEVGLSTSTMALLFSANALAGIPAARWPWSRGIPGPWIAVTALCALVLMTTGRGLVFGLALTLWGFAFWMAVPGVFSALAARSANPADRAGDAQSVMAMGRVVGPFLGGAVIDGVGARWLGLVGSGLMLAAAGAIFAVRQGVRPRPPADRQPIRAILFDIGDTLVHAAPPGTAVDRLQVMPIGDAVAELTELGRDYRLGAVTDTSVMSEADVRAALAPSGLDRLLEVIVTSVDIGAAKPDPRGLVAALAALDVSPHEAIFVGDADVDEGAARAAGVRFVRAGQGRSPGPLVTAALAEAT